MNDMAQIDEKLEDLRKIVQGTHDAVLLMGKDIATLTERQSEHSNVLWGNGRPGIVQEHRDNLRVLAEVPNMIADEIEDHRTKCETARLVSELRLKAKGFILAMTVLWTILATVIAILAPIVRARLGI